MNPSFDKLQTRALIALIFALPVVSYLLRLGGAPLFDIDEGAFSEATREMFESGNFLFTYLNGEPRFDKPIGVYWFQAIGFLIFGLNEWAFRIPSAVAAIIWCYATWWFARERLGRDAALVALAVNATALGPFIIGRAATADGLLNCLIALAMFDAWRHLETGRRAPLLRSFVWIALGILTKGPIAFIVPGAVTFLYCASKGLWRAWARAVFDPKGWIILVAIVVPWYVIALAMHGWDFIDGFFMKHNVERFSSTLQGHAGGLFYYAFFIPMLLLPWIGPLFTSVRQIKGDYQHDLRRFLWFWTLFVFLFFTASGTKLPHYMLYGITPLFLLIGLHHEKLRSLKLHYIAPTVLFAFLPLLPLILRFLAGTDAGNAYFRDQFSLAIKEASFGYFIATLGALALWVLAVLRWQARIIDKMIVAATLQVLLFSVIITPWFGAVLQGPLKEAGLIARELDENVVSWRFTAPSFSVYRNAITESRYPVPGEVALTRADRELAADEVEILYARGAVVLFRNIAFEDAAPAEADADADADAEKESGPSPQPDARILDDGVDDEMLPQPPIRDDRESEADETETLPSGSSDTESKSLGDDDINEASQSAISPG